MTLLVASACNDSTEPSKAVKPVIGKPSLTGTDGGFSGAIWTAVWDGGSCSIVDANQYASKDAVGLNGGPRNKSSGALPDGWYYVRVTGVNGQLEKELGSSKSPVVHVTDGKFDTCYHLDEIVYSTLSGYTVLGFDDTPNNGGEYKVWLDPDPTTPPNDPTNPATYDWQNSKHDNFKVRNNSTCTDNCPVPQGSAITTIVKNADGSVASSPLPLGASVHDSAVVVLTGPPGIAPDGSVVSFYFWTNDKCTGTPDAGPDDHAIASGATTPILVGNGLPQTGLGPGHYGYRAIFTSGDASQAADAEGECEPFEVGKGSPSTSTNVHDASHNNITNGSVTVGAFVHDTATLTGTVTGFTPTGKVTYSFFSNKNCSGSPTGTEQVDVGSRSTPQQITAVGDYAYSAAYGGDDNYNASGNSDCEPFSVAQASTTISTHVHDHSHSDITNTSQTVGIKIHDNATVGGAVSGVTMTGTVTFTFFANGTCATPSSSTETVSLGTESTEQLVTPAGSYAYSAKYNGDANYKASDGSDCEPITIKKATTTISTQVHDANHNNITNGFVAIASFIHDTAAVGGAVSGVTMGGTVTYSFFNNGACTGTATGTQTVTVKLASTPQQITVAGAYAYSAKYNGDANYEASSGSDCEPITLFPAGKTMGFWGNNNGVARILANGGYATNSVNIGRGGVIDTKEKAAKVLPNTTNACGKGNPLIFTGTGAPTSTKDCTAASGINIGTLNTASSQTLALGYNSKLVWTGIFTTMTVSQLGCGTFGVPGVLATSTIGDVFAIAAGLITNSVPGGSTKQADLGNLNQLLGCMNREA